MVPNVYKILCDIFVCVFVSAYTRGAVPHVYCGVMEWGILNINDCNL